MTTPEDTDQTIEQRLDEILPCINCGNQADSADGFGSCTCGNEHRRQSILQLINAARLSEQLQTTPGFDEKHYFIPESGPAISKVNASHN